MESIMINYKKLKEYITVHSYLHSRLAVPPRGVQFNTKAYVIRETQIVPESTEDLPEYDPKSHDWSDGHEATDALRDAENMELEAPLAEEEEEEEDYEEDKDLTERFAG
jgi:hypothetical protein